MALLDSPADLLELHDGQSVEFTPLRFLSGELVIQPRTSPVGKTVPALRIWVSLADKSLGAPYWDITDGTTIARLLPILSEIVSGRRRIRLTMHGVAPIARHQIDVL
mgnify:CR=1 FL=1